MKKRKGTYNLNQMRPIVEGFRDFGGTKKEYCAGYNINPYTFDYWRSRVKEADATPNKTENPTVRKSRFVSIPSPMTLPPEYYVIHLPDGKRLELPSSTPLTILTQILQTQI